MNSLSIDAKNNIGWPLSFTKVESVYIDSHHLKISKRTLFFVSGHKYTFSYQYLNDEIVTETLNDDDFPLIKASIYNQDAENGGYPPTQNGDIRSLF